MAARHAVVHRSVVILSVIRIALLILSGSSQLIGVLLIALVVLVVVHVQVLGSNRLSLVLQFDGLGQRSLLLILLAGLLVDLAEGRGASAAVFRGLAGIVLVFVLLRLAYQLLLRLRGLLAYVVGVARVGQALRELREVLWENDGLEQFRMRLALILVDESLILQVQLLLGLDDGRLEQLGAVGPLLGVHVEHLLHNGPQLNRVRFGNPLDLACADPFEQSLHAGGLKRRLESDHLVENAAKRPDVALDVVRLVLPHLRAGVVRRAGLGEVQALFRCHLAYVHVSQFDRLVSV